VKGVAEAAEAALAGRLIVLPTDTVYGLGSRPDDPAATARVFETKGRPRNLELPVLVPSIAEAAAIAVAGDRARRLMTAFWPGPLTIVLPRTERSAAWDLGGDPATVGVRMPRHLLALAVLGRTGPLAVTSANRSGEPTPATCDELCELFGDEVAVYLCEDQRLDGAPSTVVDLTGPDLQVLREGALSAADLRRVVGGGD
jgi:L-threonylcarbamoyladenylate synthase